MKNKIKYYTAKIKKDNFWNNLFKNSFWAFFGDASSAVIGLVISILLIRILGSSFYGIMILGQTYMSIIDVALNIQSWKSVIQYGQKAIVNDNIDNLCEYIKIGSILDVSTALLGGIVALFVAPFIGNIFNWSNELVLCAQIFSITIFSHFSGTPTAVLRILNKFNYLALQKFITSILKLISLIVIFFMWKNINIVYVTIVYCISDIIGNILLIIFSYKLFKKEYPNSKIIKSKVPSDFKEFISFTLWGTLGEISDIPVNYFDMFIISLLSTELVAIFKVFKQCVAILQKVTSPLQQSILPQFSELSAKGEKKKGYNIVIKIRNLVLKLFGPFAFILGMSSPIWLNVIYGKIYADKWYILLVYLLVQTYALSYTTIHPYFLTLNKAKMSSIYVLIANLIYAILAYIFVIKFGMIGIVVAYFIQCLIVINLKRLYILKKEVML